ncbi:uncharacterized protein TM35_000024230 [Trypanosoma theileri]|uniref:Uncharacterized protein n=1 Tax=Trypanosoma theileri TaxID=67003 RepID=A0A1X0P821_9TRYP|nr:uncharacterized protein TM35_000024230 [Trypanosoma theileri]ORC93097.1 hypothetical protein TM35_000024230 [Trypanosoma theileri]
MIIETAAAAATVPLYTAPQTITQACWGELQDECPGPDVDCLANNIIRIKSDICRSWITAREVCITHVKEVMKCNDDKYRQCIREAHRDELPFLCVNSPYYKSLYRNLPRQFLR